MYKGSLEYISNNCVSYLVTYNSLVPDVYIEVVANIKCNIIIYISRNC